MKFNPSAGRFSLPGGSTQKMHLFQASGISKQVEAM